MKRRHCDASSSQLLSGFTGFRFPREVIMLAVRWYLRFGLSYRDLEELLAERGVDVDHVTLHRWVQRFTPLLIDAARPCRHAVGRRWFVDETYVKVAGVWRYVYRAVDGYGQVIDVYVSSRRDIAAARTFFATAIAGHGEPDEVITDWAAALANVIAELLPQVLHNTVKYANNRVECDHGRLKARLRPMRGLKTDRTATVIIEGHAFIQNLRRGHYETRRRHTSRPSSLRCRIRRTHANDLTRSASGLVSTRRDSRTNERTTQQRPSKSGRFTANPEAYLVACR
jgi:transposase, IS6 family